MDALPNARIVVVSINSYLAGMVHNSGDLLPVSLENGHDLFSVLVEHGGLAVVASRQDLTRVLHLGSEEVQDPDYIRTTTS